MGNLSEAGISLKKDWDFTYTIATQTRTYRKSSNLVLIGRGLQWAFEACFRLKGAEVTPACEYGEEEKG